MKNCEKSAQYFRIRKDGYMISDPYVQEEYNQGTASTIFSNLNMAKSACDDSCRVGEIIGKLLNVPRSMLVSATDSRGVLSRLEAE